MKKLKIIKLKILKCSNENCWYSKKVGKSFYFFHKIFEDDDENKYKSIYLATAPTDNYAYIDDTNYKSYIRKKKLKKLKYE